MNHSITHAYDMETRLVFRQPQKTPSSKTAKTFAVQQRRINHKFNLCLESQDNQMNLSADDYQAPKTKNVYVA